MGNPTTDSSAASTSEENLTDRVAASVCHSVRLQKPSSRRVGQWVFQSADFELTALNEWVGDCVYDQDLLIDYRYIALLRINQNTKIQQIVELEVGIGDAILIAWQSRHDLPDGLLPVSSETPVTDKTFQWGG